MSHAANNYKGYLAIKTAFRSIIVRNLANERLYPMRSWLQRVFTRLKSSWDFYAYQLWLIGYQSRLMGYKSCLMGYQSCLMGYQSCLMGYQSCLMGYQSCLMGYQSCLLGYQSCLRGYQSCLMGYQSCLVGYQSCLVGYNLYCSWFHEKVPVVEGRWLTRPSCDVLLFETTFLTSTSGFYREIWCVVTLCIMNPWFTNHYVILTHFWMNPIDWTTPHFIPSIAVLYLTEIQDYQCYYCRAVDLSEIRSKNSDAQRWLSW